MPQLRVVQRPILVMGPPQWLSQARALLPAAHVRLLEARGVRDDKLPTLNKAKLAVLNATLAAFARSAYGKFSMVLEATARAEAEARAGAAARDADGGGPNGSGTGVPMPPPPLRMARGFRSSGGGSTPAEERGSGDSLGYRLSLGTLGTPMGASTSEAGGGAPSYYGHRGSSAGWRRSPSAVSASVAGSGRRSAAPSANFGASYTSSFGAGSSSTSHPGGATVGGRRGTSGNAGYRAGK